MSSSPHLGLTLLVSSQAQKEVTANEAFVRLEALQNTGLKSISVSTPPASPAEGDVYAVGAFATDEWAGHESEIAYFDQVWRFIPAREGVVMFVQDENVLHRFDGSNWVQMDIARSRGVVQLSNGVAVVPNTVVDSNSIIFLTSNFEGTGTPGFLRVTSRNDGVDFTITSSSATDDSYVGFVVY